MTGDKKLDKALRRLTSKDAKAAFRKAARPAIKPVQVDARQTAKDHQESGEHAKSIKVKSMKRSRRMIGMRVVGDREFVGFIDIGHFSGDTPVAGINALKDSADKNRKSVLRDYRERMKDEIIKMAKK